MNSQASDLVVLIAIFLENQKLYADLQYILNTKCSVLEQRYVKLHEHGTRRATDASFANTQEWLSSLSMAKKQRLYGHIQQDADIFGYNVLKKTKPH